MPLDTIHFRTKYKKHQVEKNMPLNFTKILKCFYNCIPREYSNQNGQGRRIPMGTG